MDEAKAAKSDTVTIHVPRDLHRRIVLKVAYRDEGVREVTVRALLAGLETLSPAVPASVA